MTDTIFQLHAPGMRPAESLDLGLDMPAAFDGFPVRHYWKDLVVTGDFVTPGWKEHFSRARMDDWVRAFKRMRANGVRVPLVVDHSDNVADARGQVIDMKREGNTLMGLVQVVGEDAFLEMARAPEVSVRIARCKDGKGKDYGEAIEHVSIVQHPVVPNQDSFSPIAAGMGQSPGVVVSLELALQTEAPPQKDIMLDIKPLREALNLTAESLSDEGVISEAVTKFAALNKDLELSRAAAKESGDKVIELSRTTPEPDAMTLGLVSESLATKKEAAINEGGLDPKTADLIMSLVAPEGRPNVMALSLSAGSTKPFAFRLFDALRENKPLSLGQKTGTQPVPRTVPGSETKQTEAEFQAEVDANLSRTDLGRRAIAARNGR